jgi:hypothetical protein
VGTQGTEQKELIVIPKHSSPSFSGALLTAVICSKNEDIVNGTTYIVNSVHFHNKQLVIHFHNSEMNGKYSV